ncbi:MAG: hypothetical protein RJA22_2489 [Verrucomicrobiota bacterium]|jgi:membrane protease YdiL (CAAX protease family)
MHPMRSVGIYALVVFVGGALAGPWLYWLARWLGEAVPDWRELGEKPFNRYVLRSMMLLAVAGLWPLLRSLGARSWTELGLSPWHGQARRFLHGLTLGFASLAAVALLGVLSGSRVLDGGWMGGWWSRLPGIAATALVIGALEEMLYRGAIYGGMRRSQPWPRALAVSSAIYAAAHFLRSAPSPAEVHWWSGLGQLLRMAEGFSRLDVLLPGIVSLWLAGMVLGLAYERTGSLYFSIGLHVGWVFWLRSYGYMTDRRAGAAEWLWGSGKLYDGCIALVALLVAGWVVQQVGRPRTGGWPREHAGPVA